MRGGGGRRGHRTLCRPATDRKDVEGVNNVKVVVDRNMNALYFSRAIIPHNKSGTYDPDTKYLRKLGIYSYSGGFSSGIINAYLMLHTNRRNISEQTKSSRRDIKSNSGGSKTPCTE